MTMKKRKGFYEKYVKVPQDVILALIALIPSLAFKAINDTTIITLVNAFSTTGLMIMVSVALEFDKGLNAQMLMRNYKGFLD